MSLSQRLIAIRWRFVAPLVCLFLLLFSLVVQPAIAASPNDLNRTVLNAIQKARFDRTIDFGPVEGVCPGTVGCPKPALPIKYTPNVDLAVIELDREGKVEDISNVLLSRDYPQGLVVPIDRNYSASGVRWRKWDIDRWNGGTFDPDNGQPLTTKGWTTAPALTNADDIIPGRERARYEFMSPYPASLFKILVAYRVMRLVDMRQLSLTQPYTYAYSAFPSTPTCSELNCPDPDTDQIGPETRSIQDWMDPMITASDNRSTRALLKLLHSLNQIGPMNAEFRDLGLGTLQVNDTYAANGRNWRPGSIHMTALDTARLFWMIDGTSGDRPLWTSPSGRAVRPSQLSNTSRRYLKGLLANQGLHEALSTVNLCGAANVRPGIPSKIADRWINPTNGTVTVDGIPYGQDVRPCNAIAEVVFAHKTGSTYNYGSDAGIVHSLPGKPQRHYIIALLSNQGYRYTDPVFADRDSYPCYDEVGSICYTQKIPALAKQIDRSLTTKRG